MAIGSEPAPSHAAAEGPLMIEDPANCVINTVAAAMRAAFDPESEPPPMGGGSTTVRLFAGEGLPIQAWDFHREDGCDEPFIWVRLMRRYRSDNFPAQYVGGDPCPKPVVVAIEVGVARCAAIADGECDWNCYENEAEIELDDSWRIERALCYAATQLRRSNCALQVGLDALTPYGPDGGVIAWTGALFAELGE